VTGRRRAREPIHKGERGKLLMHTRNHQRQTLSREKGEGGSVFVKERLLLSGLREITIKKREHQPGWRVGGKVDPSASNPK